MGTFQRGRCFKGLHLQQLEVHLLRVMMKPQMQVRKMIFLFNWGDFIGFGFMLFFPGCILCNRLDSITIWIMPALQPAWMAWKERMLWFVTHPAPIGFTCHEGMYISYSGKPMKKLMLAFLGRFFSWKAWQTLLLATLYTFTTFWSENHWSSLYRAEAFLVAAGLVDMFIILPMIDTDGIGGFVSEMHGVWTRVDFRHLENELYCSEVDWFHLNWRMTSQKSRRLISNLQTDLCQKICHNMSNYKITTPASLGARRTKEYCPLTLGASAHGLSCHADGEDFLAGVCGGISFGFVGLWPWLPSLILGLFLGRFFLLPNRNRHGWHGGVSKIRGWWS